MLVFRLGRICWGSGLHRCIIVLVGARPGPRSTSRGATLLPPPLPPNMPPPFLKSLIESRASVRQFIPDKLVPLEKVRELLKIAHRAPSGGNLQPWQVHVLLPQKRDEVVGKVDALLGAGVMSQGPQYNIYPPELKNPWKARRHRNGEMLYELLKVPKSDTRGKVAHLKKNWTFFGAPHGLIITIDKSMEPGQWADVGMFIQNLVLLFHSEGISTCLQESWAHFHQVLKESLMLGEEDVVFCGIAYGYADSSAPVNRLRTERCEEEEFVRVHGNEAKL